jgi:hypothetical protein
MRVKEEGEGPSRESRSRFKLRCRSTEIGPARIGFGSFPERVALLRSPLAGIPLTDEGFRTAVQGSGAVLRCSASGIALTWTAPAELPVAVGCLLVGVRSSPIDVAAAPIADGAFHFKFWKSPGGAEEARSRCETPRFRSVNPSGRSGKPPPRSGPLGLGRGVPYLSPCVSNRGQRLPDLDRCTSSAVQESPTAVGKPPIPVGVSASGVLGRFRRLHMTNNRLDPSAVRCYHS